jgi:hypothetical protein
VSFGTVLAGVVTLLGGAILLNRDASKGKAIAQIGLGVSVPHLLNKALALQAGRSVVEIRNNRRGGRIPTTVENSCPKKSC